MSEFVKPKPTTQRSELERLYQSRLYSRRTNIDNRIPAFLEKDGVTAIDLSPIYHFQESGFAIFMHGSGVTAGELHKNSDIDFSVIGDLEKIPLDTKNEFGLNVEDDFLKRIDYISISKKAENGRKLSFHLQNSQFRLTYPTKPYALEYRDSVHKKSEKSRYFLGGVSENGDMHIFTLACPQIRYKDDFITCTPQTNIFYIQEGKAFPKESFIPEFDFEGLVSLNRKTGELRPWEIDTPQEIMVLGLELNKMTEDTPFGPVMQSYESYISEPVGRNLSLIQNYTDQDPVAPLVNLLQGRAAIRTQRDGRLRITKNFVDKFEANLRKIQAQIK